VEAEHITDQHTCTGT